MHAYAFPLSVLTHSPLKWTQSFYYEIQVCVVCIMTKLSEAGGMHRLHTLLLSGDVIITESHIFERFTF